ncbi:MAG: M23 family metallopeptidase [Gammaproteobacteria bacterium]|nr:MAG: M23 family metallopeptidase [Gammaproteobacteria bacterium]
MNIILFTNKHGQVWNFEINLAVTGLVTAALLVILSGSLLYTGFNLGADEVTHVAEWRDEVVAQRARVTKAKETAQDHLDALTLRVGQLQAQLLRLNALGERLVSQADINSDEFNFDALPPVGGPQAAAELPSTRLPDFLGMLDELTVELDDRTRKLTVLEHLLMDRSLRERVIPSGRPVTEGWLSSKFGKRADPFTGKPEYHKGVDFAGKEGAGVLSVGDGVVTWSGARQGYGNLVEINHGNGYVTRYAHNKEQFVEVGDTVKKGQMIALMGSSGRATGPHVHFEVMRNGKPVNPSRYIAD